MISPCFLPHSFTTSPGEKTFEVKIVAPVEQFTRIWIQVLDRQDGSFLVRYRMYATYTDLHVHVLLKNKHVAKSPFILKGRTRSKLPINLFYDDICVFWPDKDGTFDVCVYFLYRPSLP